MPAINQNIRMTAGDSLVVRIPVLDDEGAAVDLTGASARWWMAATKSTSSANARIKKATGTDITISVETVNGVADVNVLNIPLEPTDTEGLPVGLGYHEAEVVDSDGNVSTVTTGTFILERSLIPLV